MTQDAKELIFEADAREKLAEGIKTTADIVGVTLGPKGRQVGIDASWGAPKITSDGGSIVDDIELKDQYANMGSALAKELALKVKEKSGDGTTTALILLNAFVREGVKLIAAGGSPIHIKRGMEKAAECVIKELEAASIPVEDKESILNIAKVSGNEEVGKMIFEATEKVGKSGVITIEEGKRAESSIEVVEGMQIDRGYLSGYFVTDQEKQLCELSNPKILITDKKINTAHEILNVLQAVASSGSELLIIAEDIEGEALSTLVVNKLRGTLKVAAIKAPGFGDRRKAMLADLAVLTNATVVSEETGMTLKEVGVEVLGSSDSVQITKDATTIVGGSADSKAIAGRVAQIEAELANAESKYDREKLEERKAKLSGGVAVIRVGAPTEPEMKQKKQVFQDSLSATRAAIAEGIVTGGGVALLRAASAVDSLELDAEAMQGAKIVKKALEAPIRTIISNSGKDASVVLQDVQNAKATFGFNSLSENVEDLHKAGVIDPAKVTKNSLAHAISTAGVVLLSEVLVGDAPEDDA